MGRGVLNSTLFKQLPSVSLGSQRRASPKDLTGLPGDTEWPRAEPDRLFASRQEPQPLTALLHGTGLSRQGGPDTFLQ